MKKITKIGVLTSGGDCAVLALGSADFGAGRADGLYGPCFGKPVEEALA